MNTCPVANSLARYEADYNRQQAYLDEIANRAEALIDSGDLDALKEEMTALEANRFDAAISVICHCNTRISRDAATMEIRHLLNTAATKLAIRQFKNEMDAAAEANAVERHYRLMERYEA